MSQHYAELGDVEAAMSQWTPGQLACRGNNNHWWNDRHVVIDRRLKYVQQMQQCSRCGNERWRELTLTGYPLCAWRGVPGEGYSMPKGTGKPDESGLAMIRRALLESTHGSKQVLTAAESRKKPPRSAAARAALGLE